MLFGNPLPFAEALKSTAVKALLPTDLSSAELAKINPSILEVARFSARTTNARYVQTIQDTIDEILHPHTVLRDGKPVTEGLDYATARLRLKDELNSIGYQPDAAQRGSITDLSSDQRLNLVLKTNTELAQGFGRWAQGQNEAVLDAWPCQELVRAEDREEWRDWPTRWQDAGGELTPGRGDYAEGRMIARKDDPIWEAISAFGLPYPPFDYQSGMDIRDITREEAEELGVITKDEKVQPQSRNFEEDVESSVQALTPELREALLEDLGDGYTFKDGVLTHAANEITEPTPAQAAAGNYRKERLKFQGLDIRIETPAGGIRRGSAPDGTEWSVKMPVDYGYILHPREREAANEGGIPCGEGWIAGDKECHVGGGNPPTGGKEHGQYSLPGMVTSKKAEPDDLSKPANPKHRLFHPGADAPKTLHGISTAPVQAPDFAAIKDSAKEPAPPKPPKGQHVSAGMVLQEKDGRVWLVQPKWKFGGYKFTLPKGTVEDGLTLQQTAHKELHEETGLTAVIGKHIGDYRGDTSVTRYYHGARSGGDPRGFKPDETAATRLVPVEEAMTMLNRSRDRQVLADATGRHDLLPAIDRAAHGKDHSKPVANESARSADGDHVDCYVGPDENSPHVLVIDQADPDTGEFDEHKVMLGFSAPTQALVAYRRSFSDGSADTRISAQTRTDVGTLKAWLAHGDTTQPFSESGRAENLVNEMLGISEREAANGDLPGHEFRSTKHAANEGGQPCGDSWIAGDKECHVGQGSAGDSASNPPAGGSEPDVPVNTTGWKVIGGQQGSNPASVMQAPDGSKWYVKEPKGGGAQAVQEVLAANLYKAAGQSVPDYRVAFNSAKSQVMTATPWLNKAPFDQNSEGERKAAQKAFAVHAWLGNWDAIGASYDNQVWNNDTKKITTVDTGGSLEYRAQGGKKEFGADPKEWDTMRDQKLNPQAAHVFKDMTPEALKESAQALQTVTDAQIDNLTQQFLVGDKAAAMASVLKQRRDAILEKAGLATKPEPVTATEPDSVAASIATTAAAEKKALGKVEKPLKHIQSLDVTEWPAHNSAAHWAVNKIAKMEEAADTGNIDELKKHAYDLSKTKSPNPYQKAAAQVYAMILTEMEQKHGAAAVASKEAAEKAHAKWVDSIPKPPLTASVANGPVHNAKVNALHAAALTGDAAKISAVYTKADAKQTYAKQQHAYKEALLAHLAANPKPEGAVAAPAAPAVTISASKIIQAAAGQAKATAPSVSKPLDQVIAKAVEPIKPPVFTTSNLAVKKLNEDAAAKAYALAFKGDVAGINAIDATKSPKLAEYKQKLLDVIDAVKNPPPPPEPVKPVKDLVGDFKTLHEEFPLSAKKGIYNDIGRYHVLGEFKPLAGNMGTFENTKDFNNSSSKLQKQHEAAYAALTESERAEIKAYTGSGYLSQNPQLMQKKKGSSGVAAALALEKAAQPIPEGTWLARKFSFNDPADYAKLLNSTGKVLQDPAIISTSVITTAWSGNVTVHMKAGPAVRGLYVGGNISSHKSEKEMIMVPNQRMLVQSVKKDADGNTHVYAYLLPTMSDQVSSTLK
jgi:8-oxo-dGTP pyrophosphatase MutT (NUDIX family)